MIDEATPDEVNISNAGQDNPGSGTKPPLLKEACRNEAASSPMLDEAVRPSFLDKAIHHEGP